MYTTTLIIKDIDNQQSHLHLRPILTNGLNIYSIYNYKKSSQNRQGATKTAGN